MSAKSRFNKSRIIRSRLRKVAISREMEPSNTFRISVISLKAVSLDASFFSGHGVYVITPRKLGTSLNRIIWICITCNNYSPMIRLVRRSKSTITAPLLVITRLVLAVLVIVDIVATVHVIPTAIVTIDAKKKQW